jgi:hypothetical protein
MKLRVLFALSFIFVSCQRPTSVTQTSTFIAPSPTTSVTPVPSPRPSPLPTATSTSAPIPAINPHPEFPLTVGTYWVFTLSSYTENDTYDYCCFTMTVVDNQMQPPFFLAKIEAERALISGTPSPDFKSATRYFWYAINEAGEVYVLLDPPDIASIKPTNVAYLLPFTNGQCWGNDPNQPNGYCTWPDGPYTRQTPAGLFANCYDLITSYADGPTQEWFCYNLGPAGDEYNHNGTKYGDSSTLLKFHIAKP